MWGDDYHGKQRVGMGYAIVVIANGVGVNVGR